MIELIIISLFTFLAFAIAFEWFEYVSLGKIGSFIDYLRFKYKR